MDGVVDGASSDAENFRQQFQDEDDRVLIAESLYGEIDKSRFSVTFSSNKAVI